MGQETFLHGLEWAVALAIVTIAVTGLTRRLGWSAPVALVAIGAGAAFVPGVPEVTLDPQLIFYGILPPLLFAAALSTSLFDVRARRDSILLLSVGLVAFTVVGVGFTAWLVLPSLGLAAAMAFGAVVAPTDAVAVSAMTRHAPLPRQLSTILEGESLLNDATSLVALNAAIAAIASATTPLHVASEFVIAVLGGTGAGLAIGFALSALRRRIESPVLDVSLSLVAPYAAFLLAQAVGGSGFLAVVIAGLLLGYRSPTVQSAAARVSEQVTWRTIRFLLENAVFALIGLSLPSILRNAASAGIGLIPTVGIALAVVMALVATRALWGAVITLVYLHGPTRLKRRSWRWNTNVPVVLSGARGVVTLAAVFLLPDSTPHRAFLQLLAFIVVVASLALSLLVPAASRRAGLPQPNPAQERVEAELLLAEAQTAGLVRLQRAEDEDPSLDPGVVRRLQSNATFLSRSLATAASVGPSPAAAQYAQLRAETLAAERAAVITARTENRYQEPAVLAALAVIDAEEIALTSGNRSDG